MPKTVRFLLNLTFLILLAFPSFAQIISPPRWDIQFSENKVKVGDEVELVFKAQIPINWYIYSNDFDPDLGPLLTELVLEDSTGVERVGNLKPIEPKTKFEEIWEGDVTYFEKEGEFRQSFTVTSESVQVAGHLFYQMCSDITGQCINYEEDFTVQLTAHSNPASSEVPAQVLDEKSVVKVDSTETSVAASQEDDVKLADETDRKEAVSTKQEAAVDDLSSIEDKEKASMIGFMILAFLGGLAALLTPCVFPMIPMTVTFFTGRAKSRAKGIRNALVYGFSIIAIYTLAGTLVAATQGPEFANWLSTHWLPNVFFFLVFIFFALAFLGLFEITLPAGLVNKVDAKGDKGGLTGIFFMAFTLVLVSFSCTGPIVGSILIASAGGEIIQPILGMFAFSLAFAIPFALFAIFPEWLNSLPKSGGWLNSVKVDRKSTRLNSSHV